MTEIDKPKGKQGGPRLKTREDDRRGWNTRGGQPPQNLAYERTEVHREMVLKFAVKIKQDALAKMMGISESTLVRHYADELLERNIYYNEKVANSLLAAVETGNVGAAIWWEKSRGKHSTRVEVTGKDGGPIYHVDPAVLASLSDEEFALYERLCENLPDAESDDPGTAAGQAQLGEGPADPAGTGNPG